MSTFKSYNQLLNHLRNKGLIVPTNGTPKRILEKKNYYCIINGYKSLFIDNQTKMYHKGTTFNDIYNLFLFDRKLKNITLELLFELENTMKSLISYKFSEYTKKDGPGAYLLFNKYNPQKIDETSALVHQLYSYLKSSKEEYIKHYLKNKNETPPLWVLINKFTFGDLSRFYICMNENIKLNICKQIAKDRNREYKNDAKHMGINEHELSTLLKVGCDFRNICAHDGRLYNAHSKHDNKTHYLYHLIKKMKPYVNKKAYTLYFKNLQNLYLNYAKVFSYNKGVNNIFRQMNFPENWTELLK